MCETVRSRTDGCRSMARVTGAMGRRPYVLANGDPETRLAACSGCPRERRLALLRGKVTGQPFEVLRSERSGERCSWNGWG